MDEPVVPTIDVEIRCALRALREPIHVFGESLIERRGRLRKLMIEGNYHTVASITAQSTAEASSDSLGTVQLTDGKQLVKRKLRQTDILSRGPSELPLFRTQLAQKSMIRAAHRIQQLKQAFVSSSPFYSGDFASCGRFSNALSVRNVSVAEEHARSSDDAICAKFSACAASSVEAGVFCTGSSIGILTLWRQEIPLRSAKLHVDGGYGPVQALAMHPSRAVAIATARNNKSRLSFLDYTQALGDGNRPPPKGDDENEEARGGTVVHQAAMPCMSIATSHQGAVKDLAVDPSGTLLVAASEDTTLSFWDMERSSLLYLQDGHDESTGATRVAFHPDGSLLVSADDAGTLLGWDVRVGSLVFAAPAAHRLGCWSLATSPCGILFASGGGDNFVHLWDMRKLAANRSAPAPVCTVAAHHDVVTSLSFCNTAVPAAIPNTLVSTSLDGTAKLWNARDLKCVQTLPKHSGGVRGHCWIEVDQPQIVTSGDQDNPEQNRSSRQRRALVTVARDYYWRAWVPNTTEKSGAGKGRVVETASKLLVPSALALPASHAAVPEEDDDDEIDEMELLRRRKQAKQEPAVPSTAAPPPVTATGQDNDEEDEMALLRRKR